MIYKLREKTFVPRLFHIGLDRTFPALKFNVMVMELLGPSLENLFQKHKYQFNLNTCLLLAIQLIKCIQTMHQENIIHRCIKPANLLTSVTFKDHIYFVNFKCAKHYRQKERHIPHKTGKALIGAPRYASINNHLGIEQSRRDDMETIGYIIINFLQGRLPW